MKPRGEPVNSTSRNEEKKTRRTKKKKDRQNAKKLAFWRDFKMSEDEWS